MGYNLMLQVKIFINNICTFNLIITNILTSILLKLRFNNKQINNNDK